MATFWEIAAHSVDQMYSLYFEFLVILVISRFGLLHNYVVSVGEVSPSSGCLGWATLSLVMRKPAFCICENKGADQLRRLAPLVLLHN